MQPPDVNRSNQNPEAAVATSINSKCLHKRFAIALADPFDCLADHRLQLRIVGVVKDLQAAVYQLNARLRLQQLLRNAVAAYDAACAVQDESADSKFVERVGEHAPFGLV